MCSQRVREIQRSIPAAKPPRHHQRERLKPRSFPAWLKTKIDAPDVSGVLARGLRDEAAGDSLELGGLEGVLALAERTGLRLTRYEVYAVWLEFCHGELQ